MGPTIIARNYAETLLDLARRNGGESTVDEFADAMDDVAELLQSEPSVARFLATPRVDAESKKRAIRSAFGGRVPELLLHFLLVVIEKRRQGLLRQIADEYRALVDEARGRVRAEITLAEPADEALQREIVAALEAKLGKTVVPRFTVEPGLLGGVLVRVGDQILDGTLRHRVQDLRRRLLASHLPAHGIA